MTDARLRSLERAALDDPAAAERLIVEQVRAGLREPRDPRLEPRVLDEIQTTPGGQRVVVTGLEARGARGPAVRVLLFAGPRPGTPTLLSFAAYRGLVRGGRVLRVAP